jgi:Co/Zn/Cd efflux system component
MKEALKWLAALGVGAGYAVIEAIQAYLAQAAVDWGDNIFYAAIIALITKLVGYLVGKIPAPVEP